jgi:hypothetical protein
MSSPAAIRSGSYPRLAPYKLAGHAGQHSGATERAIQIPAEPAKQHLLRKATKLLAAKIFQANVNYSFPSGPEPAMASHPIFRRRGFTVLQLPVCLAALSILASLLL